MASMFDADDTAYEIVRARECVANCQRRTLHALLCVLGAVSGLALAGVCKAVAWLAIPIFLTLPIVSALFSIAAIFHGADYLLKYRHAKQGALPVIGRMIFNSLLLSLIAIAFLAPSISCGPQPALYVNELSNIREAGLTLFAYASDHDGKYPDDLAAVFKTADAERWFPGEARHLFYKKDGRQFRWQLTPGLTTNDAPDTILLQSIEKIQTDHHEYLMIYTVGNKAEAIKNPDKDIILINGKPALREK
ncbi:MAG: hypothetical protein LBK71_05865 [Verrucomicrobiales bacterium]|jgi:hypothetical protein|nr:hypothetical protein [Verrucomicrobiales bacterium]